MFVGHYAPALLARAMVPEARLGVLFVAAQALDVGFDLLALVGAERVELRPGVRGPLALDLAWMPYSHSLLSAGLAGGACAVAGVALGRRREGLAVGLVVTSHWLLDLLVHRPDLHLLLGAEPRLGLGLWESPLVALLVELGLLIGAAAALWGRLERGRRRLLGLVAALCAAQVVVALGAAPASVTVLLGLALLSNLIWPVAAARIG